MQHIEGDGLSELVFFEEAGDESFGCVADLVSIHDDVHGHFCLVKHFDGVPGPVLDDVARNKLLCHLRLVLVLLDQLQFVLDRLYTLFDAESTFTRKVYHYIIEGVYLNHLLQSVVCH